LDKSIENIENILSKYEKENKDYELEILEKNKVIINLISNIEAIFSEFYSKDIVELHEGKILNLVKNLHNFSITSIDNKIKELLKSIPLKNSEKYKEIFE